MGTEENFSRIVVELAALIKTYEEKGLRHYDYVARLENIFMSYKWDKVEFYQELNARLGIQTNDTRKAKPKARKTVKK